MGKLRQTIQNLTFGNRLEDASEIPKSGTGLFWFVLSSYYLKLVLLNLLFVLLCLPVVTIPAAYSGLMAVILKMTRREPAIEIFAEFFREFKSHFIGKLVVWFLTTIAPMSLAGYVYLFSKNATAFLATSIVICVLMFVVQSYFFIQLSMLEISTRGAIKNAFILLGLEWKCSLKILLTGGILIAVALIFTTYVVPLIVLGIFSLTVLSVTSEANAVVEGRLAKIKN